MFEYFGEGVMEAEGVVEDNIQEKKITFFSI